MADSNIVASGLSVTGGLGTLLATFSPPDMSAVPGYPYPLPYLDFDHFEVWRASSNDRSTATLLGQPKTLQHNSGGLGYSVTRYYWIRGVDKSGNVGDWYPSGATSGVSGTTRGLIDGGTDVAAGSIPGSALFPQAITTRELLVADFSNILPDGGLTDITQWTLSSVESGMAVSFIAANATDGGTNNKRILFTGAATDSDSNSLVANLMTPLIPCEPGTEYAGGGYIKGSTGATGKLRLRLVFYDVSGAVISSPTIAENADISAAITRGLYTGIVVAPAGTCFMRFQVLRMPLASGGSVAAANVLVDSLFLRRANNGNLTVDGSIIAKHLGVDSISVDRLEIGARKFAFEGILFEYNDPATNRASWTSGTVRYIDDTNTAASVSISSGSTSTWSSGVIYVYWVKGATSFSTTTSAATAFQTDRVVVATYKGGTSINVTFGKFTIDGSNGLKLGSLVTDRAGVNAWSEIETYANDAALTGNASSTYKVLATISPGVTVPDSSNTGVLIQFSAHVTQNSGGDVHVTYQLKRDSTVLGTYEGGWVFDNSGLNTKRFPLPFVYFDTGLAAGTYVYSVQSVARDSSGTYVAVDHYQRRLYAQLFKR
jgi:hypothetical protein